MKVLIYLILISFAFPLMDAYAQGSESSPEAAAMSMRAAMRSGDYERVAGYIHPDALLSAKQAILSSIRHSEVGATQLLGLLDVDSIDTVEEMKPVELMAELMQHGMAQGSARGLHSDSTKVLGTVTDGDLAHVLVQTGESLEKGAGPQVEVLSFMQYEEEWRLLPAMRRQVSIGMSR